MPIMPTMVTTVARTKERIREKAVVAAGLFAFNLTDNFRCHVCVFLVLCTRNDGSVGISNEYRGFDLTTSEKHDEG